MRRQSAAPSVGNLLKQSTLEIHQIHIAHLALLHEAGIGPMNALRNVVEVVELRILRGIILGGFVKEGLQFRVCEIE